MVKLKHLWIMAGVTAILGGASCAQTPEYGFEVDKMQAADGKNLEIFCIKHGSVGFNYDGYQIYVDPVGEYADYAKLPKADVILITHSHGDHFDAAAVEMASKPGTVIITNPEVGAQLPGAQIMGNGDELKPTPYLDVKAVPAYNTTEGHLQFHPQGRDNGYVLTLGGTKIYVAGDTENIPEMAELEGIEIAFLPVNQPYTMTPEQAADAARMVQPKIFYPYHYGMTETETNLELLNELLVGSGIEIRIRQLQ